MSVRTAARLPPRARIARPRDKRPAGSRSDPRDRRGFFDNGQTLRRAWQGPRTAQGRPAVAPFGMPSRSASAVRRETARERKRQPGVAMKKVERPQPASARSGAEPARPSSERQHRQYPTRVAEGRPADEEESGKRRCRRISPLEGEGGGGDRTHVIPADCASEGEPGSIERRAGDSSRRSPKGRVEDRAVPDDFRTNGSGSRSQAPLAGMTRRCGGRSL